VRGLRAALAACGLAALLLPAAAAAQVSVLEGRLHVVWDVEPPAPGLPAEAYFLVDEAGRATRLMVDAQLAARLLPLDRTRVRAEVEAPPQAAGAADAGAERRMLARDVRALEPDAAARTAAAQPSYDFVTVLCRFADDPATPFTVPQVEVVYGDAYPGMRQYYAELSWNPDIMSGGRVVGWYQLPHSRGYYITGTTTMSYGLLAQDCAAAAQHDVDFRDYFSINVQVNGALVTRNAPPYDELSFGGSWTLTLNQESRSWGVTWMTRAHWNNYVVVAHEMGHALGWPHSSGKYGQEYDSAWDVMSIGYLRQEAPWGPLTIHTIAPHKHQAGWIPSQRRLEPARGEVASGWLMRTALPREEGYLALRLSPGGTRSFTAEARRIAGHDRPLPAQEVVMHEVLFHRAYVLEDQQAGNPNGESAIWRPGEMFQDSVAGVFISVNAADTLASHVTAMNGWPVQVVLQGAGSVRVMQGQTQLGETCAADCTRVLTTRGETLQLIAEPAPGMTFLGWQGHCAGTGGCTLTLNGRRAVTAGFADGLRIANTALPAGTMGAAYRDSLSVEGGLTGLTWSVGSGQLPAGVSLDASTGVISGIPEAAGSFSFTVTASSGALQDTRDFTLQVGVPTLALDAVLDALLGAGYLPQPHLHYLDLLGNRNGKLDVGDVRAWLMQAQLSADEEARGAAWLERLGGSEDEDETERMR
jgi:M6 family metalloprotease-like protein